ncbi:MULTISPECIES: DUF2164 domain-containing protein [Hyphomonas]|jgi:uncharacterized protein (DUF2164 family)|uniref:DUF2164 domain-containing protein n=2 Tax=Hyphomonas TaxID=85 RepID=A0A062ULQ5_9PROT|nr:MULTISPECIES: DUF2164 domain-containing protein [Hyphomonas]KCZ57519.1 hypothetical protein HY30_04930 [Hyphomonas chukchiensis]KDA02721.1 hypothetical protein HOC_08494 [Hyphomonas oceanitis SCH89]|tara:strand:+ start:1591 stop:1830 length:240 start_codon:yes stop_codon:yes gene_type:complete
MKEITLTPERREALCREVQKTFSVAFDETLSDFRAGEIVDLMLKTMGPAVYNQAVQDVRAHLQGKLDDLDGEVWVDGGV